MYNFIQLIQLGDSVEQSLFEKKASEISSQIELIQYKIDLSAGKGSAKRMIELMSKMNVSLLSGIESLSQTASAICFPANKSCICTRACLPRVLPRKCCKQSSTLCSWRSVNVMPLP